MNPTPASDNPGPRETIDELIRSGAAQEAFAAVKRLWREQPESSVAGFIVSRLDTLREKINLTPCKTAFLRSFTLEPAIPLLRAGAAAGGIDMTPWLGDFGAYAQDVLNPGSALYAFKPDVAIFAVQTRDIAPELWSGFTSLSALRIEEACERVSAEFRRLAQAFRENSPAHLIIHSLEQPVRPSAGVMDACLSTSQREAIERINRDLETLARSTPGLHLLDYDGLISHHGRRAWHDERKWLTMRMPISAPCLIHMANEWLRFLHPLTGRICKVLVTDLDNTLWGGVIGEDGIDAIKIGPEHPGAAYLALQQAMLDLYNRGVVLAICSKNNQVDAMEALEKREGMLLRPHHFAAFRVDWREKALNLREIAAELNVGLDSLAFIDDNPAECEWVRGQLPEVAVIELPSDPLGYAATLRDRPEFERLSLSDEDRERGRMYVEQRMRGELQKQAGSLEEFYYSLQMTARIMRVSKSNIARAAQLTQKTNQFNLTTRRFSEQEITSLSADPQWRVYLLQSSDRFGDNGIIGAALVRDDSASPGEPLSCEIEAFLLSCRVIGRTLESAFLAAIAKEAAARGASKLSGWFLPTKKNQPARELYASHGFVRVEESDGKSRWELDLNKATIAATPWIEISIED